MTLEEAADRIEDAWLMVEVNGRAAMLAEIVIFDSVENRDGKICAKFRINPEDQYLMNPEDMTEWGEAIVQEAGFAFEIRIEGDKTLH